MNGLRSYKTEKPSLRGRFFCFSADNEGGNALLYVLLAVGLLAALTYAYVKDSRENYASQSSVQISATLYSQINMIKSSVTECTAEYSGGGGDMNGDGVIDGNDNPNTPYPLNPSSALNLAATPGGCTTTTNASGCIPQAADDYVSHLQCIGAPAGAAAIFSGTSNQGRFLPPPPNGFTAWVYKNDNTGVYIQTTSSGDGANTIALNRLLGQFTSNQAALSGLTFTAWIQKN